MRRHIYAFDTPHAARAGINQLHNCGIGDYDMSLVANSRIELDEVPRRYRDASTDFVPALGRGAAAGAGVGLCAGFLALLLPALGITQAAVAVLAFVIGGAVIGAWVAALTGASVPDEIRRKYADELAAGRILLVISSHNDKDGDLIAHTMTDRHDLHLIWQSEMTVLTT